LNTKSNITQARHLLRTSAITPRRRPTATAFTSRAENHAVSANNKNHENIRDKNTADFT